MAWTFDTGVDHIRDAAGSVSQVKAARFLNERVARMVAEAEYGQRNTSLVATTVAGTDTYSMDTDTLDIDSMFIGGDPYEVVSYRDFKEVVAGRLSVAGAGGIVAPYGSSAGAAQFIVYPTPSTTGDSIEVEQVVLPADSTYGSTDNFVVAIPRQFRAAVVEGALADALEFEGRQDLAQLYEEKFLDGAEGLRVFKNRRLGGGPGRIRLRR